MKKSLLLVFLLSLGVSRLLAAWITPPPATATAGATVSVTANGYVSAPSPYGPPGFLVLWTQSAANGPWSLTVLGTSYNGYVTGSSSKTLTAGQWTWDVRSITTSPSGSSPSGTQVAWATTNVTSSNPPTPTTFTFSNLSFTYDGNVKTATVTVNPSNATYTADLTKGPAIGTYTVTATANGSFSGSGSATLAINPVPVNNAPTLHWNVSIYQSYPLLDPNNYFQAAQAIAYDADNNISQVQVDYLTDVANFTNEGAWTGFAYNGVSSANAAAGNFHDITSDNNFAYHGPSVAKAHMFRARALDSAGGNSGYIYLLVKPLGGTVGGFTIDDLPTYVLPGGTPNDGRIQKFFPNGGYHQINSRILGEVIKNISGKSGYNIWFKDGTYEFDSSWERSVLDPQNVNGVPTNQTWIGSLTNEDMAAKVERDQATGIYYWNPGSLGTFSGCSNIALRAVTTRGAVLHWASYSRSGVTTIPVAGQLFTLNQTLHQDWYTRGTVQIGTIGSPAKPLLDGPRPWPLPGAFITVSNGCTGIKFQGLEFDANYRLDPYRGAGDAGRADNGRHLDIFASNTDVFDCTFSHAPGWSFVIGAPASGVHLNSNIFFESSGDGLNIRSGTNAAFIENNTFTEIGDDSISVAGTNHSITNNGINNGGWRGILIYDAVGCTVTGNQLNSTALNGISITPLPEFESYPSSGLTVTGNTFGTIGGIRAHHNPAEIYSGIGKIDRGGYTNSTVQSD